MKRLFLPALLLLAACGTPQEQCISRNTRDLRTVDRLIRETEGNLERGYAFETVTVLERERTVCQRETVIDGVPTVQEGFCYRTVPETERRPKAIDLAAEARKLDGLKAKRVELAREAEDVIAQCRVAYPE